MAHEITETDKVISYRSVGWHGLAESFEEYLPVEEIKKKVFGWEPVNEVIYRAVPSINAEGELTTEYVEIPTHKAVVRDDNDEVLGVVSDSHELVLNQEILDIADALEKSSRGDMPVKIETAGTLKGGRKVWALVRLEEPIAPKGDPKGDTMLYYALQNSHDGSGSFRGQGTSVRVICANTAHLADLDSRLRGTEVMFYHTKNVQERIERAKGALASWREGINQWQEMADHFSLTKVTKEQRADFIDLFIPMPKSENLISDVTRRHVEEARGELKALFESPTLDYIELTAWGLVQGAVEWSQHVRNTRGKNERDRLENRFSRAYLDTNKLTQKAVELTTQLVAL